LGYISNGSGDFSPHHLNQLYSTQIPINRLCGYFPEGDQVQGQLNLHFNVVHLNAFMGSAVLK